MTASELTLAEHQQIQIVECLKQIGECLELLRGLQVRVATLEHLHMNLKIVRTMHNCLEFGGHPTAAKGDEDAV